MSISTFESKLLLGLDFQRGEVPDEFLQCDYQAFLSACLSDQQLKGQRKLLVLIALIHSFCTCNFLGIDKKENENFSSLELIGSSTDLEVDGEDVLHVEHPAIILKAYEILKDLEKEDNEIPSLKWWKMRVMFLHQRLLTHPVPSLMTPILDLLNEIPFQINEDQTLLGMFYLERMVVFLYYDLLKDAKDSLQKAKAVLGIRIEETGVLGKRTKFQTDAKAQFWVQIHSDSGLPSLKSPMDSNELPVNISMDSDYLLETPQYDNFETSVIKNELEQLVLLAEVEIKLAVEIDKSLRRLESLTYLQRVLESPQCWPIQFLALFKRSILESEEFQLQQRSIIQFEELQRVLNTGKMAWSRGAFMFQTALPTITNFFLQYADLCEKQMMFATALSIYERYQLWEQTVLGYLKIGRKARAEELILENLKVQKHPRYLCILGDIRQDEELYMEAWEISGQKYSRAMRTMGEIYFDKEKFEECIRYFLLALEINPLYPRCWFQVGYAAMQLEQWPLSASSFSKVVQLNPDDGEAWNNLAAVHINNKQKQEAFNALQQSIKFKRGDWKVWDNYLTVAMDLGEIQEVLLAIESLIRLAGKHHIDINLLSVLARNLADIHSNGGKLSTSDEFILSRFRQVLDLVGNTIPLDPEFWKVVVSFHKSLGEIPLAADAEIKHCRALLDGDWDSKADLQHLEAIVAAFTNVVEILRDEGQSEDLVYSAKLQLDSAISRSEKFMSNSSAYTTLKDLQLTLRTMQIKPVAEVTNQDSGDSRFYESASSSLWI